MADFPSFKIDLASKRVDRDGRQVDIDGDGKARIRKLFADATDFNPVVLSRLTAAEVTTLFNHYNANTTTTFNFTWPPDGQVYAVKYGGRPELAEFKKAGYFTYRVKLLAG